MKHLFECNYWFSHCLTQGTALVIVTLPHRSHRQGGSITFGTEYMGCSGFCTFCKSFTILRGTDPRLALARMCKFLAKEARLGLTFSGGACWFPQLGRKSSWAALRRDSKIWNVTRAQRRHRLTRSYPLLLTELENQRIPSKKSRTNVKTNSGFGLVLSLAVSHLLPQPHIITEKRQDSRFCARWSTHTVRFHKTCKVFASVEPSLLFANIQGLETKLQVTVHILQASPGV